MYKQVDKKQTILDLVNGKINESDLERLTWIIK